MTPRAARLANLKPEIRKLAREPEVEAFQGRPKMRIISWPLNSSSFEKLVVSIA
jgi:hypothetical protein